jgi:molybdopterin/thiamine biosynthesis adenylyltransferase
MPMLTSGGKPLDGFRSNKLGLWMRDRQRFFFDASPLDYVKVENWDKTRLCSRGQLPEEVRKSHCAIIGLGSLGSQVAMSMARMGIEQLTLVDGDSISAGNIARHIATLRDIEMRKTDLVSTNIKAVSPYVEITNCSENLNGENALKFLSNAEIIVDCTGNDEVSRILEKSWFPLPKIWISACVGYGATRIYVYTARGHSFPAEGYFEDISPWLERDSKANPDMVEGAGCWNPLFPARQDDMLLATAICTKVISEASHASNQLGLQVFEQSQGGGFYDLSRVYPPPRNIV